MKTIAKNANDFADLRTADAGNCVYVDKTDYFHGTWTATGRPSMLMNFIKREGLLAIDYERGVTARENSAETIPPRSTTLLSCLLLSDGHDRLA